MPHRLHSSESGQKSSSSLRVTSAGVIGTGLPFSYILRRHEMAEPHNVNVFEPHCGQHGVSAVNAVPGMFFPPETSVLDFVGNT
jgi:hypothetical protein